MEWGVWVNSLGSPFQTRGSAYAIAKTSVVVYKESVRCYNKVGIAKDCSLVLVPVQVSP